jgi:hypothetical protein
VAGPLSPSGGPSRVINTFIGDERERPWFEDVLLTVLVL